MKKIFFVLLLIPILSFTPAANAIIVGQELRDNDPQVNVFYQQLRGLSDALTTIQQSYLAKQQAQQMAAFGGISQLVGGAGLGFGSRGDEVKQLQQLLNQTTGSNLPVTGYFGPMTQNALNQYQSQLGMTAAEALRSLGFGDGITGSTLTMPNSPVPIDSNAPKFTAVATAYCPFNTTNITLEGGSKDERGAKLQTLHQYVVNKIKYPGGGVFVAVAIDKALRSQGFPYGQRLRIPELEQTYNNGRYIEFRVVDNGGAFNNRGKNPPDKIDIAVSDESMCLNFKKPLQVYKVTAPTVPTPSAGFGGSN